MVKMYTATTEEFDDIDLAVNEITTQLGLRQNRLAHSVAMITCYSEFNDTGVLNAVADALGCECGGCVSIYSSTGRRGGIMNSLCVSFFTSDDADFKVVRLSGMGSKPPEQLKSEYKNLSAGFAAKFAIGFFPLISSLGGEVADMTADIIGDIPLFGTVACDEHNDYHTTATVHNGSLYSADIVLILARGNINPRFYMTGIMTEKVQKQKAIITSSKGCLLEKVNDITVIDYLKSLGLARENGLEGMSSIPFIVDYNDGTPPVARALYKVTGDGYIVCGGSMPEGATLAIGALEYDDIIKTAGETVRGIMEKETEISGMVIFPCMSRIMALGAAADDELDAITANMRSGVPFHMCYSGGESCPVYTSGGKTVNRFHNFSIIALIL